MNYIGTIPKFSEIDVEFVKSFIYLDEGLDDSLVALLLASTKEEICFITGVESEEMLDTSSLASIVALQTISDNYNNRTTGTQGVSFSPLYLQAIKTLRGKFIGYRL